jgi:hypothetical protein
MSKRKVNKLSDANRKNLMVVLNAEKYSADPHSVNFNLTVDMINDLEEDVGSINVKYPTNNNKRNEVADLVEAVKLDVQFNRVNSGFSNLNEMIANHEKQSNADIKRIASIPDIDINLNFYNKPQMLSILNQIYVGVTEESGQIRRLLRVNVCFPFTIRNLTYDSDRLYLSGNIGFTGSSRIIKFNSFFPIELQSLLLTQCEKIYFNYENLDELMVHINYIFREDKSTTNRSDLIIVSSLISIITNGIFPIVQYILAEKTPKKINKLLFYNKCFTNCSISQSSLSSIFSVQVKSPGGYISKTIQIDRRTIKYLMNTTTRNIELKSGVSIEEKRSRNHLHSYEIKLGEKRLIKIAFYSKYQYDKFKLKFDEVKPSSGGKKKVVGKKKGQPINKKKKVVGVYRTQGGYYYRRYHNGKLKRISIKEYIKRK